MPPSTTNVAPCTGAPSGVASFTFQLCIWLTAGACAGGTRATWYTPAAEFLSRDRSRSFGGVPHPARRRASTPSAADAVSLRIMGGSSEGPGCDGRILPAGSDSDLNAGAVLAALSFKIGLQFSPGDTSRLPDPRRHASKCCSWHGPLPAGADVSTTLSHSVSSSVLAAAHQPGFRVAVLWRGDAQARNEARPASSRFNAVFE